MIKTLFAVALSLTLAAPALVLTLAVPAGAQTLPPGGTFVDDDGSVHEGDIEAIAAEGITLGCNPPANDRFCPDDPVTRGQMAAFMVRALDLPAGSDAFVDDEGSVFENDIDALAAEGVTLGCNPPVNDRFCPDESVTRGQMAAFLVRGYELLAQGVDLFIDDDDSVFETDIEAITAAGITIGCNPPANDRFCPDDAVTRGQMASFLTRAEDLTPIVPPPREGITLDLVAGGLTDPVYVTAPAGDDRVFIVQKSGEVLIVENGAVAPAPYLDISDRVVNSGEMGLLSIAFHPDYAANGRFFVYYSGALESGGSGDHTSYISEFTVSADPNIAQTAEKQVLTVDQPYSNHNGGHILFGPDGYLYIALGDGGGGGDPDENGQDIDQLLGSLLRIDVDSGDPYQSPSGNPYVGSEGRDEIWAKGLRNPWRIWFDEGLLYIGDVGQSAWEEIDVVDAAAPGLNFGWDELEANHCYEPATGCSTTGKTPPLIEFSHDEGCSVTGGVVYRGADIPSLDGVYLYGDLCGGFIRTLTTDGSSVLGEDDLTDELGTVSAWSFGADSAGEVYVIAGSDGDVWKLAPT